MASDDIFLNPHVSSSFSSPDTDTETILAFHASLPGYKPTPLIHLSALSSELNCNLYLKDESSRLGLPSFKILGASWGCFRALCERLDLPLTTSIADLRTQIATADSDEPLHVFAATDGNHGRAVAYFASLLGVRCTIYVPQTLPESTCDLIRSEAGPLVVRSVGNYDAAVTEAAIAAVEAGGVLIQDTAWEGYEAIPGWIVDGYRTLLAEIEVAADAVVCPVGVGSLASAVVSKYPGTVITVEPAAAACLAASLRHNTRTAVLTPGTIMTGMDCGTVSTLAFPLLRDGVKACVTVTDREAHEALLDLQAYGVRAGPCGSAALVGVKKAFRHPDLVTMLEGKNVVLLCTEGEREYDIPPPEE